MKIRIKTLSNNKRKFHKSLPEGALLCTMDVFGLYSSIQQGEGLEAMRGALDKRREPEVATESVAELAY